MPDKNNPVKVGRGILLLGILVLGGCGSDDDEAGASFRVIDAPANYVGPNPPATTTRTTTSVASNPATQSRTVTTAPSQRPSATVQPQPNPGGTPRVSENTSAEKSKPSPSPGPRSVASSPDQYPTAKPVPGKPGYVYSPYDPSGGYVDVTGYAPGSKVKDPYSGKVFLVP